MCASGFPIEGTFDSAVLQETGEAKGHMFLGNLRVVGLYEENAFTWTLEPHEAVLSLAEGSSTGEGRPVVVLPAGARDGGERRPPRPRKPVP